LPCMYLWDYRWRWRQHCMAVRDVRMLRCIS
jgi:hypothetical protein